MKTFTNAYAVSKTLRAELRPIGRTKEFFIKSGILDHDEQRADDYKIAKKLIDNYHKQFIEDALKMVAVDWNELQVVIETYRKDASSENRDKLTAAQTKNRKIIAAILSADERFSKLFKKELFTELLPEFITNDDVEQKRIVADFKKFTTYFTGFHENRKNIYSAEAIVTAVPYRLVHDNFPKFLINIGAYKTLQEKCPAVLAEAEKELASILFGAKLADIFTVQYFNKLLTQTGITFFNTVIGGISDKAGTKKIRGINEFANLYWQQHPDFAKANHRVKMVPLYKQILSDRESLSFIAEEFDQDPKIGDKQVRERIIKFYQEHITEVSVDEKSANILDTLKTSAANSGDYDLSKIYINAKELPFVSSVAFDRWNALDNFMSQFVAGKNKNEKWLKSPEFTIAEINTVLQFYSESAEEKAPAPIERKLFQALQERIAAVETAHTGFSEVHTKSSAETQESRLSEQADYVEAIKNFLDSIQDLMHLLAIFSVDDTHSKDDAFYHDFDAIYESLRAIIPLYNQVRNYLTRKPADAGKIKLNFENPTFAAGWDLNKEDANSCTLFEKDGSFYLGVLNKNIPANQRPVFPEKPETENLDGDESCYRKMIYKQIALPMGVGAFVRKCFSSAKQYGWTCPEDCLDSEGKIIIKNAEAQSNLPKIIDAYKNFFDKYEVNGFKYKTYNFKFKESCEYETLNQFYHDVEQQRYKIDFVRVPVTQINSWIDEGKLYFFQIYNKDFAEGANGTPNLHTLYLKHIFSPENLADVVIKLNGEAELFYRKTVIKNPARHKIDEKMVNRLYVDGGEKKPLPDSVHKELFEYVNGKRIDLSEDAKLVKDKITVKNVTHELVKDRRYTEDKFLFHFPITLNFKAADSPVRFNQKVREHLRALARENKVYIIGLDRGERHLLYLSLIDMRGNIIRQKSFNIVSAIKNDEEYRIDYHQKLDQREKERDAARKNWETIGKIKELKEGYLSQVIHEICKLMVEYNAIVILEDLNFGFKRGRFKVEKQVYQKFEKMLIDKLNYLVFKDKPPKEVGGVLNAYQLTDKFESFQKLGKQSGWLFYVPAAYTSKIDPATGFVNRFSLAGLTNVKAKSGFFGKFDSIRYDSETDSFAFSFCYGNFSEGNAKDDIKHWTVYTHGERIVYGGKNKPVVTVNPSENLKKCFSVQGIPWQSGESLKDAIAAIPAEKSNAPFFDELYRSFVQTLQMRNSNAATGEDYIRSPVQNAAGVFFDSRDYADNEIAALPKDADANGAYHIALKGLYWLHNDLPEEEGYLKPISNAEWFKYAENRHT